MCFPSGICTERMGIKPTEHYLFKGFKHGKALEECTVEDDYLIMHSYEIPVEYMYAAHAFISKCKSTRNTRWQPSPNGTVVRESEFLHCNDMMERQEAT